MGKNIRHMKGFVLSAITACSMSTASFAQEIITNEQPVQPPWQVCNETSFVLNIAIAGVPEGQTGKPISVWGWQILRPGRCQVVEVEKGTPRFAYAQSARLHQGGIREWKGRFEYCVARNDFTAKTDMSCELQNMTSAKFLQIVPTESRTAFVEPEDFGRYAETAGLQRLLRDNNYDIKRIDGRSGKRTTKTMVKFLKDHELEKSISVDAQFDVLEKYALETQKNIGVQFCNKSTAKIWTALAFKNNTGYEARGWWPIEKGSCIHPFVENLKGRDVHYYVRQEAANVASGATDLIIRVPSEKAKSFCIGPSKFSSLHHEFCQDRGYVEAKFMPVAADKTGVKITLTDADFSGAVVSGLRQ